MSKTVTVYTNAPAPQATVTLTLQGDVWEAVASEPRTVNFGRLTAEAARAEGLTQKVTITNNMEARAELTEVRSTSPLFQAEAKPLEPGKKFELVVTVVAPLKSGNNSGAIELATGVPEAPKLSIPISVFVVPDVEVSPDSVTLPASRSGTTTRQLSVRNNTKSPVKISDLAVSNPALKVTLQEAQPGTLYTITLEAPAGSQVVASDKITFSTDCPTVPNVVVPVRETRVPAATPGQPGSATSKPAAMPASQPATGRPAAGRNMIAPDERTVLLGPRRRGGDCPAALGTGSGVHQYVVTRTVDFQVSEIRESGLDSETMPGGDEEALIVTGEHEC